MKYPTFRSKALASLITVPNGGTISPSFDLRQDIDGDIRSQVNIENAEPATFSRLFDPHAYFSGHLFLDVSQAGIPSTVVSSLPPAKEVRPSKES